MKKSHFVGSLILAGSLLLQLITFCFQSRGAAGDVDLSFDPTGAIYSANYNSVRSVALQPDGKVIAGGYFNYSNGTNANGGIVRLNANGSWDPSFDSISGAEDVYSVVLQPDGKVLAGQMGGLSRLNPDGTLDSSLGRSGDYIYPVALQSDGKVLLSGFNYLYECTEPDAPYQNCWVVGSTAFHYRLNTNSSLDSSFTSGLGSNIYVRSIAIQEDGKVLIGGSVGPTGILRLNANGSLDSSFNPGTGTASGGYPVNSIAVQSDGRILIGGDFTTFDGTNRNGIARLNANGSLDLSFAPGIGATDGTGGPSEVNSVVLQPDGKVLIGGHFVTVNGTSRNRIARLHANGSLDSSFNPGTGADGAVLTIALQPDGHVLIGGNFTTVNGVLRPGVARLYGDAVVIPSVNITRSNALVLVSWPVSGLNYQLQETTNLALLNSWSPVAQSAVTNAGHISVTVPTTGGRKFFRLELQ